VNGRDQFTRAGRFLYLDWFNAYRTNPTIEDPDVLQRVSGRYRKWGYRHTRLVSVYDDDHWQVEDKILPLRMPWEKKPLTFRLHWLLPDWEWKLENTDSGVILHLTSPQGPVEITIRRSPPFSLGAASLVCAGELLSGSDTPDPIRGWVSAAYGVKVPALSLVVWTKSAKEVQFITEFIFPK
jgi:hypothetical protein